MKFAVIDPKSGTRYLSGLAERLTTDEAVLHVIEGDNKTTTPMTDSSHRGAVVKILEHVNQLHGVEIVAVGHRVVQGGSVFPASVVINEKVIAQIDILGQIAPLHNPPAVEGIRSAISVLSDMPHVAVFDSAFHQTMQPHVYRYAIPIEWYKELGVRRYGAHGTSHRYVSAMAAQRLGLPIDQSRIVVCHLGNGSSACAVLNGKSVDTSMGLTPLEGLVMGTRSGDVDASLPGYVNRRTGQDIQTITKQLNNNSGLLALSGLSNDMRTIVEAADNGNSDAQLAMDVFSYRLAKYIASYMVPLGGLDAFVFTGGIGENSVPVRSKVISHLEFLGVKEDTEANAVSGRETNGLVTIPGPIKGLVVPTDEELLIARDTVELTNDSIK